jgi:predicted enzyme related to lactoylglutathione lyase
MTAPVLFASVAVADLAAALPWYERLFGRAPDLVPNDDEVMWRINDGGWIYVVLDPARAGRSLAAVTVPDLDSHLAELTKRGLPMPQIEIVGTAGRKAAAVDPGGNTITFIEVANYS